MYLTKQFIMIYLFQKLQMRSRNYIDRLSNHCNPLVISLLDDTKEMRRLKRHFILDLPFR